MNVKTVFAVFLAVLITISMVIPAFSQEMPAPGTTIDKSNYKKYAHLFPEEVGPGFENGWGVLTTPIKMNVTGTKTVIGIPKVFMDYSAKNKGKFGVDAKGMITGGWAYDGLPFPDLQRNDKDFAVKLMWNFQGKYQWDDLIDTSKGGSFEKRKGEPVRWNTATNIWPFFKNRMACGPKPDMPNPVGLYKALLFHYILPDSIKNTITLSYRYTDMKKPDDTYLYLPSLRRVIRAEAGQRSSPMLGSTNALDDFNGGFDGNTQEFTYTLVKEQKVLAVMEAKINAQYARSLKNELPFEYNQYEIRDTYVLDIKPKDPKYPQSRKRIWIDKDTLYPVYTVAYDRSGKVWKLWITNYNSHALGKDKFTAMNGMFGLDVQFGMANYFATDMKYNQCNINYNDVTPAALLKRAR